MFQVRGSDPKTLQWWFDERENIDMEPPFQRRGGVWSSNDKAYLIDSILNGYDIPKFYIADFSYFKSPLNTHNKAYAVIDGKQRLEAIFDFYKGHLVLNDDFLFVDDPTLKLSGVNYNQLKSQFPAVARKFDNFSINVMSVITDEEGRINELFIRLNRSKPLVGAELRSAMQGIVPKLIDQLAGHTFFKEKINFAVTRKQDHELAAKILLIEFRGRFVDIKKTHLNRFVAEGVEAQSAVEQFEAAAKGASKVLDVMSEVFLDKDLLLKRSGVIPVYYWFVKSHIADRKDQVRPFLMHFEAQRVQNSKLSKTGIQSEGQSQIDNELLSYDVLNLTPNDQGSLVSRFNILESKFKYFK